MIDSFPIWIAPDNERVSMWSDGKVFIAEIRAGLWFDTFYHVGYSTVNYALRGEDQFFEERRAKIAAALDAAWVDLYKDDNAEAMLAGLLTLCKVANDAYGQTL